MKTILAVLEVFKGDFPKYAPTGLTYFTRENELHLSLENGTRILLILDDSLEKQLLGLKFSVDRTPGLLSSGEYTYVDARVVTKIFSCKDKTLCTKNLTKIYGPLE